MREGVPEVAAHDVATVSHDVVYQQVEQVGEKEEYPQRQIRHGVEGESEGREENVLQGLFFHDLQELGVEGGDVVFFDEIAQFDVVYRIDECLVVGEFYAHIVVGEPVHGGVLGRVLKEHGAYLSPL